MLMMIGYIFFLCLFMVSPLIGKIILLILNLFIVDPIPCIDEIIMTASTMKNIYNSINIFEFFENHRIIFWLLVIVMIMVVIALI